jgi:hypothetical protein
MGMMTTMTIMMRRDLVREEHKIHLRMISQQGKEQRSECTQLLL